VAAAVSQWLCAAAAGWVGPGSESSNTSTGLTPAWALRDTLSVNLLTTHPKTLRIRRGEFETANKRYTKSRIRDTSVKKRVTLAAQTRTSQLDVT